MCINPRAYCWVSTSWFFYPFLFCFLLISLSSYTFIVESMEHSGLSSDIMYEILSRTPLKTMASCRLLSQECNSLSYEADFMSRHCERTNTIAGYFLQALSCSYYDSTFVSVDNPSLSSELRLNFLPHRPKTINVLGSADGGLMLCENPFFGEEYYVCKPSTKEFETIPKPRCSTIKVGLMVLGLNPLRFKVVRLFEPENEDWLDSELYDHCSRYSCEVFNSDTWTWKRLKDLSLPRFELQHHPNQTALSTDGGLHWLTTSDKNILSFYEDEESWELVPLPESENKVNVYLTKYEGKLSLVYVNPEVKIVELWVIMKDSNNKNKKLWSKRLALDLAAACDKEGRGCSALSFYNSDILFMTGYGYVIFYNFKSGQVKRVELDSGYNYSYPPHAVFIQTDCEPVNFKHESTKSSPLSPS